MKIYTLLLNLGIIVNFSIDLDARVYGYQKLNREKTNTTIDILYDVHSSVPHITIDKFFRLDRETAKKRLYPTEQKCMKFFEEWSKDGHTLDLIWEDSSCGYDYLTPRNPCFISLAPFFRIDKLSCIRFICADRYRRCGFTSLFSIMKDGKKVRDLNLTCCSFKNPAPLSSEIVSAIQRSSGVCTWLNFKSFYERVIKEVKDYFRPYYESGSTVEYKKHFTNNYFYHALCDVEILSHVLASQSKRIVVYAGGWHCKNIADFLIRNGFSVVYSKISSRKTELDVRDLSFLEGYKVVA
ncbi:hypothetical protein H0X06_05370 [Candidatus Dependentiae bacterium]|nr:hypothetical protein [Candidatus Dependentiae bacterium]